MYRLLPLFSFIDFIRLKPSSKMPLNFILFFGLVFGQSRSDTQIADHNKTKMVLSYYDNGTLKEEDVMSDGKEVGRWIYYTDNGNADKELDHDQKTKI